MRKRTRLVTTRVTEEQYKLLKEQAKKQGITLAHLIRRELTRPEGLSEQPVRSYTPKHGRRVTPQQVRRYIAQHPEIIKQYVARLPPVRKPPQTMEELASVVAKDTMEMAEQMADVRLLTANFAGEYVKKQQKKSGNNKENLTGKWKGWRRSYRHTNR